MRRSMFSSVMCARTRTRVSFVVVLIVAVVGVAVPASGLPTLQRFAGQGIVFPQPPPSGLSSLKLLQALTVKSENRTGYARSKFQHWIDADHDSCDTRDEVLITEAKTAPHVGSGCALTGGRWVSAYDNVATLDPSTFDVDHLVPLAEAWDSGANVWDTNTRMRYANDLGYAASLIAVTASTNRSKADREPQSWMPPRTSYRCTYLANWVAVKWRWHLATDTTERSYLISQLGSCNWPHVATTSRQPVTITGGGGGGGGSATSGVVLTAIAFDPPGSDPATNAGRNLEIVTLTNTTSTSKTITGWTLRDVAAHVYTFPSLSVTAGAKVYVHTGSGTNGGGHLYWGSGSYIWNNTGDTATLRNAAGTTVDICTYGNVASPVSC